MDYKKSGLLFVGGVLFGTAGIGILASREAKKVYVGCTAAALRAKACILDNITALQVTAEDILAEAQEKNEASTVDESDE